MTSINDIYIISYRRPQCSTASLLKKLNYPGVWYILVESDDPFLGSYMEAFGDKVRPYSVQGYVERCDLMDNFSEGNQGAAPARNAAIEMAQNDGVERFWLLDDDFTAFTKLERRGKRSRIADGETLYNALRAMAEFGLRANARCIGGVFDGRAFPPNPISYCCRAMLNLPTNATFRSRMEEDLCFNVDSWRIGGLCLSLNLVGYVTPPSGAEDGGLTGMYDGGLAVRRGAYHVLCNPFAKVDFKTVRARGALPNLKHYVPKVVSDEWKRI